MLSLHIVYSRLDINNENIRVFPLSCCIVYTGEFIKEHPISIIVPSVFSKEPGCMHVQAPGCLVAGLEVPKIISLAVINPHKILHQHFVNCFCCFWLIHDDTSIEHTTNIAIVRIHRIGSNPMYPNNGNVCSMLDGCVIMNQPETAETVYEMLMKNFMRVYYGETDDFGDL